MAFSQTHLHQGQAHSNKWGYNNSGDDKATIEAAGYFDGMVGPVVNDYIHVNATDASFWVQVTQTDPPATVVEVPPPA